MALFLYGYPSRRQYGLSPEDLFTPFDSLISPFSSRPWDIDRHNWALVDGAEKKSHVGKDGFQVSLDVQHFQPNEISVRTENNSVVVHAKHEEKQDNHGFISREFTRRYELPDGFKVEDVTSSLSSDGILTVKAPHVNPAIEGKVRQIQIQQTGPARSNVATNKDEKENDEPKTKNGK